MNVNSKQYWDTVFALGQWKANGGEEQTRYFAEAQCRFFRMHRNFSGTILDLDRKSTRLNSSHIPLSRMPSSA